MLVRSYQHHTRRNFINTSFMAIIYRMKDQELPNGDVPKIMASKMWMNSKQI